MKNLTETNQQADRYASELLVNLNNEVLNLPEKLAYKEEKSIYKEAGSNSAMTQGAKIGERIGKPTGAAVGGALGYVIGTPTGPGGQIAGATVGLHVGQQVGELSGHYLGSLAGAYVWKQMQRDNGINKIKNELQTSFREKVAAIENAINRCHTADPETAAYVKRQVYQRIQHQPYFSLLSAEQRATIKNQISNYDSEQLQRLSSRQKDTIHRLDELMLEQSRHRNQLLDALDRQMVSTSKIESVLQDNATFLKQWQTDEKKLSKDTELRLHHILMEQQQQQNVLKDIDESVSDMQETERETVRRAVLLANYQGVQDGFAAIQQLGGALQSSELQKIGLVGQASAQIAFNTAWLAGGLSTMAAPTGLALLTPYTAIAMAGLTLIQAFCRAKSHGKDPLHNMLLGLQEQIKALRTLIIEQFKGINEKLDGLISQVKKGIDSLRLLITVRVDDMQIGMETQLNHLEAELHRLLQQQDINHLNQFIFPLRDTCAKVRSFDPMNSYYPEEQRHHFSTFLYTLEAWITTHSRDPLLTGLQLMKGHDIASDELWAAKVLRLRDTPALLGYLLSLLKKRLADDENRWLREHLPENMIHVGIWQLATDHYLTCRLNMQAVGMAGGDNAQSLIRSASPTLNFLNTLQEHRVDALSALVNQVKRAVVNFYEKLSRELYTRNCRLLREEIAINELVDFTDSIHIQSAESLKDISQRVLADLASKNVTIPKLIFILFKAGIVPLTIRCDTTTQNAAYYHSNIQGHHQVTENWQPRRAYYKLTVTLKLEEQEYSLYQVSYEHKPTKPTNDFSCRRQKQMDRRIDDGNNWANRENAKAEADFLKESWSSANQVSFNYIRPTDEKADVECDYEAFKTYIDQQFEQWLSTAMKNRSFVTCLIEEFSQHCSHVLKADLDAITSTVSVFNSIVDLLGLSHHDHPACSDLKIKPLNQTATNDALNGLVYQKVPGNGHCLFQSICMYTGQDVDDLRRFVAARMESDVDKDELRQFFEGSDEEYQTHIDAIRNTNEWGDALEIEVIQRLLNRPIIIIRSDVNPIVPDNVNGYDGEPIFVYYNGRNHYDALILEEGNDARDILDRIQKYISDGEQVIYNPMKQQNSSALDLYAQLNQFSNPNYLYQQLAEYAGKPISTSMFDQLQEKIQALLPSSDCRCQFAEIIQQQQEKLGSLQALVELQPELSGAAYDTHLSLLAAPRFIEDDYSDDETDQLPNLGDANALKVNRIDWSKARDAMGNPKVPLGRGAFGAVYAGLFRQGQQVREVAIKSLSLEDQELSKTFHQEIQAAMRATDCSHVIRLYGISQHRNKSSGQVHHSLLMEKAEMTLADYLNNLQQEPIELTCDQQISLCLDIARGLMELHQKNIVHKDIKDTNILLVRNSQSGFYRAKLSDLGISDIKRQATRSQRSKTRLQAAQEGTLAWQAPEVVCGNEHTLSSDVFSLALVMWRIATQGDTPFGEVSEDPNHCRLPMSDQELGAFYKSPEGFMFRLPLNGYDRAIGEIIKKAWASLYTLRPLSFSRVALEKIDNARRLTASELVAELTQLKLHHDQSLSNDEKSFVLV